MKIGILGHAFVEWTGGFDFLRMVTESLLAASGDLHELQLLLPIRGPRASLRRVARRLRDTVRKGPNYPDPTAILRACSELDPRVRVHLLDRGYAALGRYCKKEGVAAVLPTSDVLPASFPVAWIGYVGDFQHKHLPQFFSAEICAARDAHFSAMLQNAPAVLMNAREVALDADRFVPGHPTRKFVLPFSAAMPHVVPASLEAVNSTYGIDAPYFIVSNQFWLHKDHATAFKAFAEVRRTSPNILLVCTGETSDPRAPGHFAKLMQLAEELGISPRLRVLGLIPKADQLALLQGSIAAVQPTLSEGGPGGGMVFDAVGLGVPAIVSDLPVNREINEPQVTFFAAGDPRSLAAAMLASLSKTPSRPSADVLSRKGTERRMRCGAVILEAIDHAIAEHARR